jgi:hypothetical protein
MSIMMIIEENLLLTLGDIVDNLFRYYFSYCLLVHWLVISRCIFVLIAVLFCAVANQVSHLT